MVDRRIPFAELRAFVADGSIVTGGMDRREVLALFDVVDAARDLREAVLALDEALTGLIGTTDYPDALTTLHGAVRDAAFSYDRVIGRG